MWEVREKAAKDGGPFSCLEPSKRDGGASLLKWGSQEKLSFVVTAVKLMNSLGITVVRLM